ncbi:MAG: cytochrome c biogenesis CcdA family protein [Brevinematia bacterium]
MEISVIVAFFAGVLSFLSPCILPLVLPYISFISGISVYEIKLGKIDVRSRSKIVLSTLYFIIGFTLVFILFGIVAGYIGGVLISVKDLLSRIAGLVFIAFGVHLLGIFRIPFLDYEKRFNISVSGGNFVTSMGIGMAFGFGWTPCIGPILGGILGIAFYSANTWYGALLLATYSLGLSIPFFIVSIFVNSALMILSKLKKLVKLVEIVSGIILILIGIVLLTGNLGLLANYILELFPFLLNLG